MYQQIVRSKQKPCSNFFACHNFRNVTFIWKLFRQHWTIKRAFFQPIYTMYNTKSCCWLLRISLASLHEQRWARLLDRLKPPPEMANIWYAHRLEIEWRPTNAFMPCLTFSFWHNDQDWQSIVGKVCCHIWDIWMDSFKKSKVVKNGCHNTEFRRVSFSKVVFDLQRPEKRANFVASLLFLMRIKVYGMNSSEFMYQCIDTSLVNTNSWRNKISGEKF